jgi:cyanophycinase
MAVSSASGAIIAVGGAEEKFDRRQVLERFVMEAGGRRARVAILPTASAIPEERASFYAQVFADIGVGEAFHVPIASREDAQHPDNVAALADASGVFLTGGDQARLVDVLTGTPAFDALWKRLVAGGVLAGTSAGASAFSATMIAGGQGGLQLRRDAVRLAPGLGIIQRLIIDQHFSQRDRLGRLLAAIALEPERLGVGIDEDTAIVYWGSGELEVIGSGHVFVVDAQRATTRGLSDRPGDQPFTLAGVRLHVLTQGDRFSVTRREPLPAAAH